MLCNMQALEMVCRLWLVYMCKVDIHTHCTTHSFLVGSSSTVGHSRAGAVPQSHPLVHSGLNSGSGSL